MIAVVGMGFMGRTHAAAYEAARRKGYPVSIAGVLSRTRSDIAGDPGYHVYPSLDALLDDSAVQAVSICTHTDSHIALTKAALAAGKHVLVEKPLGLDPAEISELAGLAAGSGRLLLPALCMRHWPGWPWLRDRITAGTFGPPLGATFVRTSARPDWSAFYEDDGRSGSALFDLHLHDADFIRWCWGTPVEVASRGQPRHVITDYRLSDGPSPVTAEGGWLEQPDAPFRMRYTVEFAEAVVDFDVGRDPTVLVTRRSGTEPVLFPPITAYELQVEHFLDLILGRTDRPVATVADAYEVTRLLAAERRSLECGASVPVAGARDGP